MSTNSEKIQDALHIAFSTYETFARRFAALDEAERIYKRGKKSWTYYHYVHDPLLEAGNLVASQLVECVQHGGEFANPEGNFSYDQFRFITKREFSAQEFAAQMIARGIDGIAADGSITEYKTTQIDSRERKPHIVRRIWNWLFGSHNGKAQTNS